MLFYITLPPRKRKPLIIHTATTYAYPDRKIRLELHNSQRWWAIEAANPSIALSLAAAHWSFLHSPRILRPFKPPRSLAEARIITTSPGNFT